LNKPNELDFEINKDLLNKFKKTSINEERDNSFVKNLKPEGVSLNAMNMNKKIENMLSANNNINRQNLTLGTNEREFNTNNSKKLLKNFQNQLINNDKENNYNNLNSGNINQNKQKVLSENLVTKNFESNATKSFLTRNLEERVNTRSNPEYKY
jgi:hypothetical protein